MSPSATHSSRSALAVSDIAARVPGIDLTELMSRAELQTRFDTKFIVFPTVLDRLVGDVGGDLQVLDISSRRQFGYSSTYFDTPDLRTYRDHVQGRRRRFKIRTRTYVDSGLCTLEVKVSGVSHTVGVTDKHRVPHPIESADTLTSDARETVTSILHSVGLTPPSQLCASATTAYQRVTFVDRCRATRMTVDADLDCVTATRAHRSLRDRVLVEIKSESPRDPLISALARLGARPLSVSKYCVAAALLVPGVPTAPWRPVLRRHFLLPTTRYQVLTQRQQLPVWT